MRIALAKLLLAKPNLLLLDEPTNHLDLETRNWLENYLRSYPFGYILISHDRYFLDVTVSRTVEIWNKRLQIYAGNYTKYLKQKEDRKAQLIAAYKNQREQIEHLAGIAIVHLRAVAAREFVPLRLAGSFFGLRNQRRARREIGQPDVVVVTRAEFRLRYATRRPAHRADAQPLSFRPL